MIQLRSLNAHLLAITKTLGYTIHNIKIKQENMWTRDRLKIPPPLGGGGLSSEGKIHVVI
jgi:hypothetical protein